MASGSEVRTNKGRTSARPGKTRLLVVGGHTRNIGKSALVVDLIRQFPEAAWLAVKITQCKPDECPVKGKGCGCALSEHAFALDEERDRNNRTDTSRFLIAGAARSLWLRTKRGRFSDALPLLQGELAKAENAIFESNAVLQFFQPTLYLVVLDPAKSDFKDSAREFLDRADAFVLRGPLGRSAWAGVPRRPVQEKPQFRQKQGEPLPATLAHFVRQRFFQGVSRPVKQR